MTTPLLFLGCHLAPLEPWVINRAFPIDTPPMLHFRGGWFSIERVYATLYVEFIRKRRMRFLMIISGPLARFLQVKHMVPDSILQSTLPSEGTAYRNAFRIAWPSAIESAFIALISAADTMMVGSLGPAAISAVGISSQPRMIMRRLIISLKRGRRSGGCQPMPETRPSVQHLHQLDCLQPGLCFCHAYPEGCGGGTGFYPYGGSLSANYLPGDLFLWT